MCAAGDACCSLHDARRMMLVTYDVEMPVMTSLKPSGYTGSMPFLAVQDDIGHRDAIATHDTPHGTIVIEDVLTHTHVRYRRMVLLQTGMIQSEARLVGDVHYSVDHTYLACTYHHAFLTHLSLLPTPPRHILMLGLGAGSLAMWLLRCMPHVHIDAVEWDADVVQLAKQWFGLEERYG